MCRVPAHFKLPGGRFVNDVKGFAIESGTVVPSQLLLTGSIQPEIIKVGNLAGQAQLNVDGAYMHKSEFKIDNQIAGEGSLKVAAGATINADPIQIEKLSDTSAIVNLGGGAVLVPEPIAINGEAGATGIVRTFLFIIIISANLCI